MLGAMMAINPPSDPALRTLWDLALAKFEARTGTSPGSVAVLGRLSYQGCTESLCLMPSEQAVEARLEIATE